MCKGGGKKLGENHYSNELFELFDNAIFVTIYV